MLKISYDQYAFSQAEISIYSYSIIKVNIIRREGGGIGQFCVIARRAFRKFGCIVFNGARSLQRHAASLSGKTKKERSIEGKLYYISLFYYENFKSLAQHPCTNLTGTKRENLTTRFHIIDSKLARKLGRIEILGRKLS